MRDDFVRNAGVRYLVQALGALSIPIASVRTVLLLSTVPLFAFTCVPRPNSVLLVQPDYRHTSDLTVKTKDATFQEIESLIEGFAQRFGAVRGSCSPSWWWKRPEGEPCALFSANRKEGIIVEAFRETSRARIHVVLYKSPRIFGRFGTNEVEDTFLRTVLLPLTEKYGEENVQVKQ